MTRDVRVLVTGFGPFPGVPNNVSAEIAEECAKSWSARPGIIAESLTLATDWQTAPGISRQHIEVKNPDIVIHLGVSGDATCLTLETHAYNECCDTPDVSGHTHDAAALCPGSPPNCTTKAPIAKIAERLVANGHRAIISDDPGRYLCNAVYHETLSLCSDQDGDRQCIFVHIPTELSNETVTRVSLLAGLDIVLDTMRSG